MIDHEITAVGIDLPGLRRKHVSSCLEGRHREGTLDVFPFVGHAPGRGDGSVWQPVLPVEESAVEVDGGGVIITQFHEPGGGLLRFGEDEGMPQADRQRVVVEKSLDVILAIADGGGSFRPGGGVEIRGCPFRREFGRVAVVILPDGLPRNESLGRISRPAGQARLVQGFLEGGRVRLLRVQQGQDQDTQFQIGLCQGRLGLVRPRTAVVKVDLGESVAALGILRVESVGGFGGL